AGEYAAGKGEVGGEGERQGGSEIGGVEDAEHGSEDLVARQPVVRVDADEDSRADIVAVPFWKKTLDQQLRRCRAAVDVALNAVARFGRNYGRHKGGGVVRRADNQALNGLAEAGDRLVGGGADDD